MLPSKKYFDRTTVSLGDEFGKEKIFEKGKISMISPLDSEKNGAWKNRETRAILVMLFGGKRDFDSLMKEYVNTKYAAAKKDGGEDPFPFGDYKQIFLKHMVSLKILGLVEEISGGMLFKESFQEYTLTENGAKFVKRNLMDTIKEENFEFFIIILQKENSTMKVHHLLMKLLEKKKLSVDQMILTVRHRQPALMHLIISDYVDYLDKVEGEDPRSIDMNSLKDSVLKKLSSLLRLKLIAMERNTGEYSLTEEGVKWIDGFTTSMDPFIDFLKKTGMIDIKKKEKDYFISLTEIGKELGKEIEKVFQNDESRILDRAKSIMNDSDDHEISSPLPIHHKIQESMKREKDVIGTIYLQPTTDKPWRMRLHETAPAVVVSIAVIFAITAIVGLCMMPRSYNLGLGMIAVGVVGAFMSMSMYIPSLDLPKKPQYVDARKERKRYKTFIKRTEGTGSKKV